MEIYGQLKSPCLHLLGMLHTLSQCGSTLSQERSAYSEISQMLGSWALVQYPSGSLMYPGFLTS